MATFTVNRKQSLVDVCLQIYGSTQFLFKLAKDNGLFIDSDLSRGSVLTYEPLLGNPDVKLITESQGLKMVNPGVDLSSELVVVDFDGVNDYVLLDSIPDVTGNKKITFDLFLDLDSGYPTSVLFYIDESDVLGSDHVQAFLNDNYIVIKTSGSGILTQGYSISGLNNTILNCELIKNSTSIISFKINGLLQVSTNVAAFVNANSRAVFGSMISGSFISNATIFNIKIYDDPSGANTLTHSWPGTGPNANTDAAWVDAIGGINGTVFGSPATRVIS